MKLLFYIHGLSGGGAERVMATLMNGFAEQGHKIRVVYTETFLEPMYKLDSRIEQIYMLKTCPRTSSTVVDKVYRRIWKYSAIRKLAQNYKPDFVISFIKTHNNDVLAALLGTGIPVVIGDHTNVDRKYAWRTSTLSNLLYPFAGAITMLTLRDYNKWEHKYKHVYYIPNPCDIKPTRTNVPRKKVVLGVGRVNQWGIKGFDNLIKAWSLIKDKYPDWKCQIAGMYSNSCLDTLCEEVGEESFKSVEFIGFRADIHEYMESCEVFCLSSRIEGMPMALLEALNMGCACVSFDCVTGPSEMIEDGKNGFLVKDQDINELAIKLERVIIDEELRSVFRKNAPRTVQKYSTENILNMWNQMFNELKSVKRHS